jgi:hypothetical protein
MSGAWKTNLLLSINFQFDTSRRLPSLRSFLKKKSAPLIIAKQVHLKIPHSASNRKLMILDRLMKGR